MSAEVADLRVRPAIEADLPRLAELLDQLRDAMVVPSPSQRNQREENLRHFIRAQEARLWVAEHQGRIVGLISVTLHRTLLGAGPVALIEELVVDESHRGRGVGRRLVRQVTDLARAQGLREVEVATETTNTAARDFYRACGFHTEHVLLEMELDS
jgi:ribosomal protein S18 acetylase RimI-like enzyme